MYLTIRDHYILNLRLEQCCGFARSCTGSQQGHKKVTTRVTAMRYAYMGKQGHNKVSTRRAHKKSQQWCQNKTDLDVRTPHGLMCVTTGPGQVDYYVYGIERYRKVLCNSWEWSFTWFVREMSSNSDDFGNFYVKDRWIWSYSDIIWHSLLRHDSRTTTVLSKPRSRIRLK